jgi:hypothetical protein
VQKLRRYKKLAYPDPPLIRFNTTIISSKHNHFVECVNTETWDVAWRMHPSVYTQNRTNGYLLDDGRMLEHISVMLSNSETEHRYWPANSYINCNDRRLELKESRTIAMSDHIGTSRFPLLFRIMPADRKKRHDAYQAELTKKETERKLCPIFRKNIADRRNVQAFLNKELRRDFEARRDPNAEGYRRAQEKIRGALRKNSLRITKTLSDVWNVWKRGGMRVKIPIHNDSILNSPIATPFETGEWMVMDHPWYLFVDGQVVVGPRAPDSIEGFHDYRAGVPN